MNDRSMIDYLVVGHVTRDVTPNGLVAGGTVTYSSRVAQALGCRTAVVTSAAQDIDLNQIFPGMEVIRVPSDKTTTFENTYTEQGRKQVLRQVASKIRASDIPVDWQRARVVHLGPVANEIAPDVISLFSNSLVGLTPQGWYRRWNDDGQVYIANWPGAEEVIKLAGAVVVSPEDLPTREVVDQLREWCQLVFLTLQSKGSIVYFHGESQRIAAPSVQEVNPTGAGDVFAASLFVRLYQTRGNPWEAAKFANQVAATSVSVSGLTDKMNLIKRTLKEKESGL